MSEGEMEKLKTERCRKGELPPPPHHNGNLCVSEEYSLHLHTHTHYRTRLHILANQTLVCLQASHPTLHKLCVFERVCVSDFNSCCCQGD